MRFELYEASHFYDEMFEAAGRPRSRSESLAKRLLAVSETELQKRQLAADNTLRNMGITFAVYGNEAGTEKVWPFDILPRIVEADEWTNIERGLKQRIRALNMFPVNPRFS